MMANELKVFENTEFGKVRTMTIDGKPYFVGKDVAEILGYSNSSKAVSNHVDDDDKQFVMVNIAHSQNGNMPIGQTKTAIINESGLYSLILSSKLPNAKKFKRWVTSEVLPEIRKTGSYSISKPDSYMIDNPIDRAKRWIEEQQEKLALEQKVEEQKPMVEFAEQVSDATNLVDVGSFAKLCTQKGLRIGRNKLFEILRNLKILRYNNEPYQRYINDGYLITKEYTYNSYLGSNVGIKTYITGKGQRYLYNILKQNSIY